MGSVKKTKRGFESTGLYGKKYNYHTNYLWQNGEKIKVPKNLRIYFKIIKLINLDKLINVHLI